MLTYQRYIIINILLPLLVISLIVTGLVWLMQVIKFLYLVDNGIRLVTFIKLVALFLPSLLFVLLPFITILAVIYCYNILGEERQLIILKSCGLSNIKLAKPALVVAFITTLISYYISISVMPDAARYLIKELDEVKDNYAYSIVQEKTFSQISKFLTLYINEKKHNKELNGLVLLDNRGALPIILFAKSGNLIMHGSSPMLNLNHGMRQAYDNNGNLTKLTFDSLTVELSESGSKNQYAQTGDTDIREYDVKDLLSPSKILPRTRQIKLIAEGHQRILWPFYNFALTFLGLAVFLRQPYNKKSHLREMIFTSASIIAAVYCHFTFQNLAYKDLNFVILCYINIVIIMLISLWLYLRRTI